MANTERRIEERNIHVSDQCGSITICRAVILSELFSFMLFT